MFTPNQEDVIKCNLITHYTRFYLFRMLAIHVIHVPVHEYADLY